MTVHRLRAAFLAVPLLGVATAAGAAPAAQVNTGDTAWMLFATTLVMLMILPGLALFYGGLVRTKNTLSMLAQVFSIVCITSMLWVIFGYSLAFTTSGWPWFVGGASKLFLQGVSPDTTVPTLANGYDIPEYVFIIFQMMIACIAPALMVGAFAERMRYAGLLVLVVLWVTIVYVPLAHMTWFSLGPDAIADAAKSAVAASTAGGRRAAELHLQTVLDTAGLFRQWGVIDAGGGAAIHISAGIAGLVGAIFIGQRSGYGQVSMAPNNLALTMLGGCLLWVGWLGYTAGMGLRANGTAALAMLNVFMCAAAAAWSWTSAEWMLRGKPSLLGMLSGALAGLVAITPSAAVAGPVGAIALGLLAGAAALWFSTSFKSRYDYDDALDVFGVHCIAGVVGLLAAAVLASPKLGGSGIADLIARPGEVVMVSVDVPAQLVIQLKAVIITLLWSGVLTAAVIKSVDRFIGLRADPVDESRGLDIADHGERAYNG